VCSLPLGVAGQTFVSWRSGGLRLSLAQTNSLNSEGDEQYFPTLLLERKMRWFASFAEGCAEGQRWSGRTQSYVSRSPEQQIKEKVESIATECRLPVTWDQLIAGSASEVRPRSLSIIDHP
jgi:hypothetical protein